MIEIAEEKMKNEADKEKSKNVLSKISSAFDQLPNKQMLMGFIDKKSTITMKTTDRLNMMNMRLLKKDEEEKAGRPSAIRRGDILAHTKSIHGLDKKAPINVTREAINSTIVEDEHQLLKENNVK